MEAIVETPVSVQHQPQSGATGIKEEDSIETPRGLARAIATVEPLLSPTDSVLIREVS